MFGRFAKFVQKALPLSTIMGTYLLNSLTVPNMIDSPNTSKLASQTNNLSWNNNERIKHVRDLGDYIEKILVPGRSIILFQLTGDLFVDAQVVALAQNFVNNHSSDISLDFQFIFLEESQTHGSQKDQQNYFIVYSPNGQKLINIDNYINKSKQKADLRLNSKPLMKRLTQSLNTYKEVGLDNIITEFNSISNDCNYVALYAAASNNYKTENARKTLKSVEKQYTIKNKYLHKYVIKDQQTRRILGVKSNEQKVYLLVADNKNLKKQFRQKANFFQINGKRYTNIDISQANLNEIFVFPPIQKSIRPQQFVLNVYINKNINYEPIEQQIYEQLSKPQYANLPKAIYYTNDVEEAAIYYQQNDYSKLSLLAYQTNTNLGNSVIKHLLTNTFQYQYKLKSNDTLQSEKLRKWLQDSRVNKIQQYFPSQKPQQIWAHQITGEQYKEVRDQPFDKVIYHYSHHCHGCKKFGGKYEQFAKNRNENHPNINFYRINNDLNKSQGIKNYNSTPVFVFYKKGSSYPFIYKIPFFTEKLFDAFLKITSQVKLIPVSQFQSHIKQRKEVEPSIKELLNEVRV